MASARSLQVALLVSFLLAACGDTSPRAEAPSRPHAPGAVASAADTAAEPPDVAVPKLRTGAIAPIDAPDAPDAKLLSRYVADGVETLVAELPMERSALNDGSGIALALDGREGDPAYFSFAAFAWDRAEGAIGSDRFLKLWLRRSASASGSAAVGQLFVPASGRASEATPGARVRFRLPDTKSKPSDPKALELWLHALSYRMRSAGAWQVFASERLERLALALSPKAAKGSKARNAVTPIRSRAGEGELAQLMETTTGATAVQEALQQDRALFLREAKEKATVPLASLKAPPLGHHPWKDMLAKLGAPKAESLAANAPADFYYVRAKDLPSLFRLLDAVDDWGTPAASIAASEFEDRAVAVRYEAELGLKRSALARALGGAVVGEVGFVGSDPYVKEGSDVTMLLRVKSRPLFDAALAATLAEHENAHGALTRSTRTHAGVTIAAATSPDGAVRQQRATLGDTELVSNSPRAIDTVIDTAMGTHPKLADELDFKFMLARDAGARGDVLAYMGDRFVAEVVGPKQKIQEARRSLALADLMTPGFAALLHGWLYGKSPATVDDLFQRGLLAKEELSHANGAAITWKPGTAARSSWGTVASLTPLIDLPALDLVTPSEKAGYERFARTYQDNWSGYVDPVALRVAIDEAGAGGSRMTLDLRQLPLIDGTEYRKLDELVGAARFTAGPLASGARGIMGLGQDAWARGFLSHTARGFSRRELKFDWVGDWAMVGMADRSEVAATLLKLASEEVLQMPAPAASEQSDRSDWIADVGRLPLYAEVGIKSAAGVAIALAGLRMIAEDTIPGMFEWGEVDRHRDVAVVRIKMKGKAIDLSNDIAVYYAVSNDALIVALQEWVLHRLIDDRLDGRGPDAARGKATGSTQMLFDLASDKDKGLWSVIAWMAEKQLLDAHRGASLAAAEALLRGAPETRDAAPARALAFAYLGALPLAPDGGGYTLAKEGPVDPTRGSEYAPRWPSVPVPGSPLEKVMRALTRVRTELSFDDEGQADGKPMRSLHAKVTLDTR